MIDPDEGVSLTLEEQTLMRLRGDAFALVHRFGTDPALIRAAVEEAFAIAAENDRRARAAAARAASGRLGRVTPIRGVP